MVDAILAETGMNSRMTVKMAKDRLAKSGLEATDHRVRVLMAVGNTTHPTTVPEILELVRVSRDINRVTVYRILDLLVEHAVLNRLGLGEKSQRFCLREMDSPGEHPHFHCTRCDRYLCLDAPSLPIDRGALARLALDIDHVEIHLEGICPACQGKESLSDSGKESD